MYAKLNTDVDQKPETGAKKKATAGIVKCYETIAQINLKQIITKTQTNTQTQVQ